MATFPASSVSDWFPLATSSTSFPPATFQFPLGSQETTSSFLNTTRRVKRIYDMSVLVFYRHDLLARALEEGIVVSMRAREFKQFSQVHKARKWRTEIDTWVFLTTKFTLFHYVILLSITSRIKLSLARIDFLDQDPILSNQFYISPKFHPS